MATVTRGDEKLKEPLQLVKWDCIVDKKICITLFKSSWFPDKDHAPMVSITNIPEWIEIDYIADRLHYDFPVKNIVTDPISIAVRETDDIMRICSYLKGAGIPAKCIDFDVMK
jgi:hypothetical protein